MAIYPEAQQVLPPQDRFWLLNAIGAAHFFTDRMDEAIRYLYEALETLRGGERSPQHSTVMSNLAASLVTVGDYAPARELAEAALAELAHYNNAQLVLFARSNLAEALTGIGEHAARARDHRARCSPKPPAAPRRAAQNHYMAIAAEILARHGASTRRRAAPKRRATIYADFPGGFNEVHACWADAVVADAQGDRERALALLQARARDAAERHQLPARRMQGVGAARGAPRRSAATSRRRTRTAQAARRADRAPVAPRERQVLPAARRARARACARRARPRRSRSARRRERLNAELERAQRRPAAQDDPGRGVAGAARGRGGARSADAALQPALSRFGDAGAARRRRAARRAARARAGRPRSLQAGQRPPRPSGRRRGAARDRRACCRWRCGRPTSCAATAARSSASCCPMPTAPARRRRWRAWPRGCANCASNGAATRSAASRFPPASPCSPQHGATFAELISRRRPRAVRREGAGRDARSSRRGCARAGRAARRAARATSTFVTTCSGTARPRAIDEASAWSPPTRAFPAVQGFHRDELEHLFERTRWIKDRFKRYEIYQPLRDRTLAMVFEKASTRTRVSFEAGMNQLGGIAINLNRGDTQLVARRADRGRRARHLAHGRRRDDPHVRADRSSSASPRIRACR